MNCSVLARSALIYIFISSSYHFVGSSDLCVCDRVRVAFLFISFWITVQIFVLCIVNKRRFVFQKLTEFCWYLKVLLEFANSRGLWKCYQSQTTSWLVFAIVFSLDWIKLNRVAFKTYIKCVIYPYEKTHNLGCLSVIYN